MACTLTVLDELVIIEGVLNGIASGTSTGQVRLQDGDGTTLADVLDLALNALAVAPINTAGVHFDAATAARQDTGNTSLASIDAKLTNPLPISGTVTANAGTGTFVIGDGGGSITVDGGVTVSGTVDTELPTAVAVADDLTPSDAPYVQSLQYGYVTADGNWDRWRMAGDNADSLSTAGTGHMQVLGHGMVFNGTTWDRMRGTIADGVLVNLGSNNDVTVTGTVTANAGTGTFVVGDGGGSLTVDGTVAATQSGTWVLGANSGVDIGDVTINNAAGAAAVNIQDGGNSITIDGSVTANPTRPATNTTTSVSASASSVTILSANANRLGATIYNDSTSACYIKLGTTASTASFQVKVFSQDYYEVPFGYTGRIDAIWDSATGSARIGELTA